MSDSEADRKAEIVRVQEMVKPIARQMGRNFVLDTVRVKEFTSHRVMAIPGEGASKKGTD